MEVFLMVLISATNLFAFLNQQNFFQNFLFPLKPLSIKGFSPIRRRKNFDNTSINHRKLNDSKGFGKISLSVLAVTLVLV
jgi:hypothetical protein